MYREGARMSADEKALELANWINDKAIGGIPPLTPAEELALLYRRDKHYLTDDERTDALIDTEIKKNFTTGFITGFAGILSLPVAVPSAFAASWVLQARLAASVASIYGHDIDSKKTRTLILLCLVGDKAEEVLQKPGSKIGMKAAKSAIARMPGRMLNQINTNIGRLLLRLVAGRTAMLVARAVPILGGVIAGGYDAYSCRHTGRIAKEVFKRAPAKMRPSRIKSQKVRLKAAQSA